jgi:N-acetylglucosaminyl-diphospho-decaprenol L-rhamnosyltransferase
MTTDFSKSTLVISIINYRTGAMTIAAAASVLEALGTRPARVIITDNASNDGSEAEIATWINTIADARVELIRSATNTGFSGGHNQAFAAAPQAGYYLILNSDALLREDFFDQLLPAGDAHPKAGLIAPRLEWEDGTAQISSFRFATPLSELIRSAQTGAITRALKRFDVPLSVDPDPAQIEWASFACILLRGEMVQQIGPMDDGYFLYFEDEEYALRAQRAGWSVSHVPSARAVHFRGGSGPVKSLQAAKKRLPEYYYISRTRFLRQKSGPMGPILGNLCWHLGRIIAQARRLVGRSAPPAHENEWRDIWTHTACPLRPDPRSPAAQREKK